MTYEYDSIFFNYDSPIPYDGESEVGDGAIGATSVRKGPRLRRQQVVHFEDASSAISSAAYDDDDRSLEIVFTNGSSYLYQGVGPQALQGLADAPSPGEYFHRFIAPNHQAQRLS